VDPEQQDKRLAAIRASVRQYLAGIEAAESVFPLGALHLGASLIDALARLTCDENGGDFAQYKRFVTKYLPSEYHVDDLPKQLYAGLRAAGLHNLSVGRGLALMDGQLELDRPMHLRVDSQGRRIIRVEEFLAHLRLAVDAWENDINGDDELKKRLVDRERRNPVFEIIMIETLENSVATTSSLAATGIAGYPMMATASASAAVGRNRFGSR
jgi:hypothetical protein